MAAADNLVTFSLRELIWAMKNSEVPGMRARMALWFRSLEKSIVAFL